MQFFFQNSSHLDYLSKYDDSNGVDGYENGDGEVVNLSKISKHQINGSSEKKIKREVSLKIFNPTLLKIITSRSYTAML